MLSRVSIFKFSFLLTPFTVKKPEIIVEYSLQHFILVLALGCTASIAAERCRVVEQLSVHAQICERVNFYSGDIDTYILFSVQYIKHSKH